MTREVVMEPEGASVEVITVAPGGSALLEEIGADTEARFEAGEFQWLLEAELKLDADLLEAATPAIRPSAPALLCGGGLVLEKMDADTEVRYETGEFQEPLETELELSADLLDVATPAFRPPAPTLL